MIISHKHKFIFIKTRKTAGTSIEVFLSQHCGEEDVLTPINPRIEPHIARNHRGIWNILPDLIEQKGRIRRSLVRGFLHKTKFYNHIPARIVKRRIPRKIWKDYFKFCVERNPWDKTLSHYHWINGVTGGGMTLDQYMKGGVFCINYPAYTDREGGVIVDRVIKYESLIQELTAVFDMLGISFAGDLGTRAKSEYRKDRRSYREVFNAEHKEVIERAFVKEIELHGYIF